jgi:hypothetical protein
MSESVQVNGLTVLVVETPSLGDRSYLVHDGEVALVVDPQRDIDRVLALLDEHRVRLTHVLETHIHNDYVTGGPALAAATGAAYLVNADDPVHFERTPVHDGETIAVGDRMRLTALATPGHTFTHLSYALTEGDRAEETDAALAVFTGGSLLFGSTGRPTCSGPTTPRSSPGSSTRPHTGWSRCFPTRQACCPPTGSGRSARPPKARPTSRPSARSGPATRRSTRTNRPTSASCWPGWRATPPTTRTWLRETWPGQTVPTCPRRPRPTRTSCGAASRPASGWWTCGTAPRSLPGTCPAP